MDSGDQYWWAMGLDQLFHFNLCYYGGINFMAKLNEADVIKTDKGIEFTVGEIQYPNRIVKSATPNKILVGMLNG